MTNDEINKYIHTEIMGHENCICPTDCDCENYEAGLVSNECPVHNDIADPVEGCPLHDDDFYAEIADYCSDESPRSLLNEVVAKVVGQVGREMYARWLTKISTWDDRPPTVSKSFGNWDLATQIATMPTVEVARACVAAHQASRQTAAQYQGR